MRRTARQWVDAILFRLEQAQRRTIWSHNAGDPDAMRQAWFTLYLAYYEKAADPAAAACRKVYGCERINLTPSQPEPLLDLSAPPAILTPHQVDGRTGRQWVESVLEYLNWRSGRAWRPMSHRFHETVNLCDQARRLIYDAFYRDTGPQQEKGIESSGNSPALARAAARVDGLAEVPGHSGAEAEPLRADPAAADLCADRVAGRDRRQHGRHCLALAGDLAAVPEHMDCYRKQGGLFHCIACGKEEHLTPEDLGLAINRNQWPRCCGNPMHWLPRCEQKAVTV
ncbi:MAG: hypothetical protein ACE14M_15185 [Terriglobales bacterium]